MIRPPYVGAIETAEKFGERLYLEAWNRGWDSALRKVVIGDGAVWIWNLADQHCSSAIQIVDLYHAQSRPRPSLGAGSQIVPSSRRQAASLDGCPSTLTRPRQNKTLTVALRLIATDNPEIAEKFRSEADYFHRNALRMRYPKFRRLHLFVGSGVIEAGCKTVIGRLKQSGMFWTVLGANAIIALRCCCLNDRFEDYWEDRHAA